MSEIFSLRPTLPAIITAARAGALDHANRLFRLGGYDDRLDDPSALHVALCGPSAVLMPVGIVRAIVFDAPDLAICASLLWLAGCFTFLMKLATMAISTCTSVNVTNSSLGSSHNRRRVI